jgi:hypothetical protein
MPKDHRKVRPECEPERVAAALDALWIEARERPALIAGPADVPAYMRWCVGWHERVRRQWGLLGEWALAAGEPRVVWRAILQAEWLASCEVLKAEVEARKWEQATHSDGVGAVA